MPAGTESRAWLVRISFTTLRLPCRRRSGAGGGSGAADARSRKNDLRHLTSRAVGRLGDRFHRIDDRIAAYLSRRINDPQAHDLVIKATDCGALMPSQIPAVLQEWRAPEHDDFRPRNAWSLFNACTEVFKGLNPNVMVNRNQALHGLFEGLVGLR